MQIRMKFWRASQNANYDTVVEEGTLWTYLRSKTKVPGRVAINDLAVGDIVFHYKAPAVRAVSVVTRAAFDHIRPDSYSEKDRPEGQMGWLANVDPLEKGLFLERQDVAELIQPGTPGPLYRNGSPRQNYIAPLSEADGRALIKRLGVSLPKRMPMLPGRPNEDRARGESDDQAWQAIRNEQTHLREHLLNGEAQARCSICTDIFPERLLIAGHIKRRSQSTEEERWDFERAAMLVCSLGCDSLFEHGYIIVRPDGMIVPGNEAETPATKAAISRLSGTKCSAHNALTAANFAAHAQTVSSSTEEAAVDHQ
jgi:hypothetical protein